MKTQCRQTTEMVDEPSGSIGPPGTWLGLCQKTWAVGGPGDLVPRGQPKAGPGVPGGLPWVRGPSPQLSQALAPGLGCTAPRGWHRCPRVGVKMPGP